jgi:hypothetical protein
MQVLKPISWERFVRFFANRAPASLIGEHAVVVCKSDAVVTFELRATNSIRVLFDIGAHSCSTFPRIKFISFSSRGFLAVNALRGLSMKAAELSVKSTEWFDGVAFAA